MDQPVRVCRVGDRYPLPAAQCCELSVARVERCKLGGVGKIFVLSRLVFREVDSFDPSGSAIEDFQIEPVADARLPAWPQIPVVFRLDLSGQIQDHATSCEHVLQKFDRCQPTHC